MTYVMRNLPFFKEALEYYRNYPEFECAALGLFSDKRVRHEQHDRGGESRCWRGEGRSAQFACVGIPEAVMYGTALDPRNAGSMVRTLDLGKHCFGVQLNLKVQSHLGRYTLRATCVVLSSNEDGRSVL